MKNEMLIIKLNGSILEVSRKTAKQLLLCENGRQKNKQIRQEKRDKENLSFVDKVRETYLKDPNVENWDFYSDVYKDYYGIRPHWDFIGYCD